jgi:FMN phosphatase YigB (HAD superfamily)
MCIGDNPHKDFLGARAAGLASVRLRLRDGLHFNCEPQDPGGQPDFTVFEFAEIPRAIDSVTQRSLEGRRVLGDPADGSDDDR